VAEWNAANDILKRGIAVTPVKFGISFTLTHLNQAGALVHVYQDGSIHMNHGGTEMGQGLFQKVAQVAADRFGVGIGPGEDHRDGHGKVPNTSATAASSGSDLNGMAVKAACDEIRGRIASVVAPELQASERRSCSRAAWSARRRGDALRGGGAEDLHGARQPQRHGVLQDAQDRVGPHRRDAGGRSSTSPMAWPVPRS
jgi:CO/xanthine dehydrogenase Mo-binding subunit